LYDADDLKAAGKRAKLPFRQLTEDMRCVAACARTHRMPSTALSMRVVARSCSDRELLAGVDRRHSNLDDAEFDCHVFSKARACSLRLACHARCPADALLCLPLPAQLEYDRRKLQGNLVAEAYFVRNHFDPATMRMLGPWAPPLPLGQ
jgi:hypothetical protein